MFYVINNPHLIKGFDRIGDYVWKVNICFQIRVYEFIDLLSICD